MRNYNREMEAAYLTSRRQGNEMRDRERERSSHENRKNRYIHDEQQYGTQRYPSDMGPERSSLDSYRTADSGYRQMLTNNRGKGPRNYRRPDERIKEDVCDNLCEDPYLDASDVNVEVKDTEVILTGSVEDRYAKRLAEDLAESVSGVRHVENRIRVNQDRKQLYQREHVNQEVV